MKAKHCDECTHATFKWYVYRGGEPFDVLVCAFGHKARFYKPKSDPTDDDWGWKRVCGDFNKSNEPLIHLGTWGVCCDCCA